MIRRLFLLLTLSLLSGPALAQEAKQDFHGTLQVTKEVALRLAVHISAGPDGKLTGTLDSLDQGALGIPLAQITRTADKLSFTIPSIGGAYRADRDGATWKGEWSQAGQKWPLVLEDGSGGAPAAPPPPLPTNWSIPADDAIGTMIHERLANRPDAAIVIGVTEPSGHRIVSAGPDKSVGATTIFEIGSMTKVFTSLLLADMVEKGEVRLDDPADKYLPAGTTLAMKGRKITLADLATHGSGLPRLPDNMPFGDPENPYADYTEAMMLAFLSSFEPTRAPGEQFEYSNLGAGLLGYLLARRAGTDYATLVHQRITGPLGMNDTLMTVDAARQPRFIAGHDAYMRPASHWDLPTLAGAGALRSTADDMLRFLDAAMGRTHSPLDKAFARMTAKRWPGISSHVDMGLGWMLAKGRAGELVFHDGATGGFRSTMAYDPQRKRGVVVLTNAAVEPSSNDLAMHLLFGAPVTAAGAVPAPPAEAE